MHNEQVYPLVSILVPTYNRGRFIAEAIHSALTQSYGNFEVVVVDDGSDDNTAEIINKCVSSKLRYISKEHSGAPATRNRCIAESRGEYLLWLDSDDVLMPDTLMNYIAILGDIPGIDVIYGNIQITDDKLSPIRQLTYPEWFGRNHELLANLFSNNSVPNPATLVRKSCYDRFGNYDLNFPRAHDYEFWSRLAGSAVFKHCDQVVVKWRWHDSNMSSENTDFDTRYEAMVLHGMLLRYSLPELLPNVPWSDDNKSYSQAKAYLATSERLFSFKDYIGAFTYAKQAYALCPNEDMLSWVDKIRLAAEEKKPASDQEKLTAEEEKPALHSFRVVAIISAYNEGDVIYHVIGDLINNGIEVYLIDNNSTDNTIAEATRWLGKGLLHIEHFPQDCGYPEKSLREYVWKDILQRKEDLSYQLGADWYIHADADEFRETPWLGMKLADGIAQVADLGYNAINFTLLNFRPTDNNFEPGTDVREHLICYELGEEFNQVQIKAWANNGQRIRLADSGGHEVQFDGRKVFPQPFILRHYPIRSENHGRQKIFVDRLPRFNAAELASGWHVQYHQFKVQAVGNDAMFLRNPSELFSYDPAEVRRRIFSRFETAKTATTIELASSAQLYFPTEADYTEPYSLRVSLKPNEWQRITYSLEAKSHDWNLPIRFDPCNHPALVEIAGISVETVPQEILVWQANTPSSLNNLDVKGTARKLPHDDYLQIFSYGDDAQVYLPLLDVRPEDGQLKFDIWMRLTVDCPTLTTLLKDVTEKAYRQQQQLEKLQQQLTCQESQMLSACYAKLGWSSRENILDLFDADYYVNRYPDVIANEYGPLWHYLKHGAAEGRSPHPAFDVDYYVQQCPEAASDYATPLHHYLRKGASEWHNPHPLFDTLYYLGQDPEAIETGLTPLQHYFDHGARSGLDPHPLFDTSFYLDMYPEVQQQNLNPLVHFIRYGALQGKRTHSMGSLGQSSESCARSQQEHFRIQATLGRRPKYQPSPDLLHKMEESSDGRPGQCPPEMLLPKSLDIQDLSQPYISVIIPTYNRAALLPELLNSWREVARRTTFPFEIIFSDDGSTDETCSILEAATDLPLRVIRNPHRGVGATRNAAIMQSQGKKILIVGDDIFPSPYSLQLHAKWLQHQPDNVAILGAIEWHPALHVTPLMHHITEWGQEQFSFPALTEYGFTDFRHFYTSNISLDRDFLLKETVFFDEGFVEVNFEDIELGYRLQKRGARIFYAPEAVVYHYHPYSQVVDFVARQERAGRMAITFTRLHPEVAPVLGVKLFNSKALTNGIQRYPELVSKAHALEEEWENTADENRPLLIPKISSVYSTLLALGYEVGMASARGKRSGESPSHQQQVEYYAHHSNELNELLTVANKTDESAMITSLRLGVVLGELPEATEQAHFHEQFGPYHGFVKRLHETAYVPATLVTIAGISPYSSLEELPYDYIYCPSCWANSLSEDHLRQALLCLAYYNLDFVIISHSLSKFPFVNANLGQDHLIGRPAFMQAMSTEESLALAGNGRCLRLMPSDLEHDQPIHFSHIFNAQWEVVSNGNIHVQSVTRAACPLKRREQERVFMPRHQKQKKVIFVFPIFMAVGGVERNTIEVMRHLKDTYDFVVITFERHTTEIGSLHHQLPGTAVAFYDLAEIALEADFLPVLHQLKEIYQPNLIWICNGCPWSFDHALDLRRLFFDIAIIDQSVYDIEVGWINRYPEPGIQTYDHYIAINQKISQYFESQLGLEKNKIELIYPSLDATRFNNSIYDAATIKRCRDQFGFSSSDIVIVWIGRMQAQKRPLLFLEVVSKLQSVYPDLKFLMIGQGDLDKDVADYILEHHIKNVTRCAFIENTAEVFACANGLFMTSAFEGLPIVMIEAMCMGLPVLASDVGDIALFVERHNTGLAYPKDSTKEQICHYFDVWYSKLTDYKSKAVGESDAIRSFFDISHIGQQYAGLFEQAIGTRRPN